MKEEFSHLTVSATSLFCKLLVLHVFLLARNNKTKHHKISENKNLEHCTSASKHVEHPWGFPKNLERLEKKAEGLPEYNLELDTQNTCDLTSKLRTCFHNRIQRFVDNAIPPEKVTAANSKTKNVRTVAQFTRTSNIRTSHNMGKHAMHAHYLDRVPLFGTVCVRCEKARVPTFLGRRLRLLTLAVDDGLRLSSGAHICFSAAWRFGLWSAQQSSGISNVTPLRGHGVFQTLVPKSERRLAIVLQRTHCLRK